MSEKDKKGTELGTAPECKGCGAKIQDNASIQALDGDWHSQCFRCSVCNQRLSNWYLERQGQLYCRRDYWNKFDQLCNGCLCPISGLVMVAGEHRFHPECFQCTQCHTCIGDQEPYALLERSTLYCGACYNLRSEHTIKDTKDADDTLSHPKSPRREPHTIQMVEISLADGKHGQNLDPRDSERVELSIEATSPSTGRRSFVFEGGRVAPAMHISRLPTHYEIKGLEVGDKILEVNGATVRDKSVDEVSNLFRNHETSVHVMLERDLSPLRETATLSRSSSPQSPQLQKTAGQPHWSPQRESTLPQTPQPLSSSPRSAHPLSPPPSSTTSSQKLSPSTLSKVKEAESKPEHEAVVKLRPKNSLKAKGHSPTRRRSKSPSPCPATRQKSLDLNRSHSFSTQKENQKVYRTNDLILGEVLGQGFFGQAIKVKHRITDEILVLKELHNFDADAQKSFLREVSMLRNLAHPCVLKFLGVLFRDKKLNLLTEFVDGGTLSEVLLDTNRELSWIQRVKFAKDIAAGMTYLHSMDIIHRDLNSQNCLVRKNMSCVVADFGLAKIVPRHKPIEPPQSLAESEDTAKARGQKSKRFSRRKRQTVVGNPYWMAPEMMIKGVYDEKVDVFSYGIIVCETIARVTADPDYLPRSIDFGLNVGSFHRRFCQNSPEPYFKMAVLCAQIEPDQRPNFETVHMWCEALVLHLEHGMAVPTDLQGDAVQFYKEIRNRLYGENSPDCDTVTEAEVTALKNQEAVAAANLPAGDEQKTEKEDEKKAENEKKDDFTAKTTTPDTEKKSNIEQLSETSENRNGLSNIKNVDTALSQAEPSETNCVEKSQMENSKNANSSEKNHSAAKESGQRKGKLSRTESVDTDEQTDLEDVSTVSDKKDSIVSDEKDGNVSVKKDISNVSEPKDKSFSATDTGKADQTKQKSKGELYFTALEASPTIRPPEFSPPVKSTSPNNISKDMASNIISSNLSPEKSSKNPPELSSSQRDQSKASETLSVTEGDEVKFFSCPSSPITSSFIESPSLENFSSCQSSVENVNTIAEDSPEKFQCRRTLDYKSTEYPHANDHNRSLLHQSQVKQTLPYVEISSPSHPSPYSENRSPSFLGYNMNFAAVTNPESISEDNFNSKLAISNDSLSLENRSMPVLIQPPSGGTDTTGLDSTEVHNTSQRSLLEDSTSDLEKSGSNEFLDISSSQGELNVDVGSPNVPQDICNGKLASLLSPQHERGLSSSRRRLKRSAKNLPGRDHSPFPN